MVGRLLRIPTAHMAIVGEPGGSSTIAQELPRSMAKVEHSFVVVQRWQRCDVAQYSADHIVRYYLQGARRGAFLKS